jgi:RNA polymerase sigma-70 factor (ECF subfamily)
MATLLSATDTGTAALVAAASRGEVLALEQIIALYHRDLTRVCVVVCGGDGDLAEEAAQAAWPIAWQKIRTLRDPDRLRPWLISIAANQARMLLRQRRRGVVDISAADELSNRDDPSSSARQLDLRVALQSLEPQERELLALRYVAGFDSTEIGRALGMSASGVRTRLERLLARLRKELDDD